MAQEKVQISTTGSQHKHKTYNISSSSTLFLKYFLPLIWMVFFGTLLVVFLVLDQFRVGEISPMAFKIAYTVFFFAMLLLMYFTVFRLKRVELDDAFVYVTNYFKTARYPYSNIEKISRNDYGIWLICKVHFKSPGQFGKSVTFLANRKRLQAQLDHDTKHSSLFE